MSKLEQSSHHKSARLHNFEWRRVELPRAKTVPSTQRFGKRQRQRGPEDGTEDAVVMVYHPQILTVFVSFGIVDLDVGPDL